MKYVIKKLIKVAYSMKCMVENELEENEFWKTWTKHELNLMSLSEIYEVKRILQQNLRFLLLWREICKS